MLRTFGVHAVSRSAYSDSMRGVGFPGWASLCCEVLTGFGTQLQLLLTCRLIPGLFFWVPYFDLRNLQP